MADTLEIFGVEYTNVAGIKASTPSDTSLTYIRPQGSTTITSNGTVDVTNYASAVVNVPSSSSTLITKSITANGTYNASSDNADGYSSVSVNVPPSAPTLQTITKSYTPTESQQTETITAGTGYDGIEEVDVTVGAISSTYVGSGITRRSSSDLTGLLANSKYTITAPNGYYDVNASFAINSYDLSGPSISVDSTGLITATASIASNHVGYYQSQSAPSTRQLTTQAAKTVTPTESEQTAVASGVYTTGVVKVGAISSTYIGSEVTQRDETDLTASGATVTVPAGYYAEQETKSVASGSATPAASISGTSATVTTGTNTITLTKSVSNTPQVSAGYISSGTAGSSSVSLTASVTVDPTPTASGATVTVPAGYYSSQTTKSVSTTTHPDPTVSVNTSTGLITASHTQTAGYVSAGTTTKTSQLSVQSATTITPTKTSQQAVAANKYTVGAVTVAAIPAEYISTTDATAGADDIVSGETAYVNGSKLTGSLVINKYYTGSSTPSASLGSNGDIYFKTS